MKYLILIYLALAFGFDNSSLAEEVKPINESNIKNQHTNNSSQENTLEYKIEEEEKKDQDPDYFIPRIERLFENPAIITSLERGTDTINRSIESLMDSIFYSLLDNELRLHTNDFIWLSLNLSRQVFTTTRGAYVVVDKFAFGPQIFKPLANIHGIPIYLGGNTQFDVLDIYLRTDAQRLAEYHDLHWTRYLLNTWFGILPILARILPPSFNSNELYDPLRQIYTPFVFPDSKDSFLNMPIGSVRSYAISGGIQLPINLAGRMSRHWQTVLSSLGAKGEIPYGLFISGEFRINVLRKSQTIAWVGLTKRNDMGDALNMFLGGTYFILKGALAKIPWQGLIAPVIPIDFDVKESLVKTFNQLYQYDLSNPKSEEAYLKALKGDFISSQELAKDPSYSGVTFHFNKYEDANITNYKFKNNLFLLQDDREKDLKKSQITLWDAKGESHLLEAQSIITEGNSNILVGREDITYSSLLEMKVIKIADPKDPGVYTFQFIPNDENPYQVRLSLEIKDRFTDAKDFNSKIDILRNFSQLPLKDIPFIPLKSEAEILLASQRNFFIPPDETVFALHVPYQNVGKFTAQSTIVFTSHIFSQILEQPEDKWWQAFLSAFMENYDFNYRYNIYEDPAFLTKIKKYLTLPTHLVSRQKLWNVSLQSVISIIESLRKIRSSTTPIEMQDSFHELFKTDDPDKLIAGLFLLCELEKIPRQVNLYIQPSSNLAPEIVHKLKKINASVYTSKAQFPPPERHKIAKEKLNAFFPNELKELRIQPSLSHISIFTRQLNQFDKESHIFVDIIAKNLSYQKPAKIYIRLEQSGKLMLGKYVLGQSVIELPPMSPPHDYKIATDDVYFAFYLTGPKSPLSDFIFDQSINLGGEFLLSVAVSEDGNLWSKEKTFRFYYSDGKLLPPGDDASK